jgi:Uma2 family endonuclease
VCVLPLGAATEGILIHPPLITIEILSPEDTKRNAAKKASEYLDFGIEHVWVIDPYARIAYRFTTAGLEHVPSGELTVPGTPIAVRTTELFAKLDWIRSGGKR